MEVLIVILLIIVILLGECSAQTLVAVIASVWVGTKLEYVGGKNVDPPAAAPADGMADGFTPELTLGGFGREGGLMADTAQGYFDDTNLSKRLDYYPKETTHDMYDMGGCRGDTLIAEKMKHMSTMSKRSMDIRAKFDRYSAQHLFDEELHEHENRRWWDNQDDELRF